MVGTAMYKSIVVLFLLPISIQKGFYMEVIKFSLDLSNIERKNWEEDIESTALWMHRILGHNHRRYIRHGFDKVRDFDFAYTINPRYKRAVVFIKSEAPKRNLRVFKWRWTGQLNHKWPFAVIRFWARIPIDVEHYVLKNGKKVGEHHV